MKATVLLLLGIANIGAIQLSDTINVLDFEDEMLVDLDLPSDPVAGRPVVNYLDPVRQKHTDKVIKKLGFRVFDHYHDSVEEYNDTVKSLDSGNYKHPEPKSQSD